MKNTYLEPFIKEIDKITSEVNSVFGSLTANQLNWKPSPEKWSIGQCLEHIMVSNSKYFPMMNDLVEGIKKRTIWERLPFYSGIIGKMLISTIKKESRKVKTFKVFMPSKSEVSKDIIKQFNEHQEILKKMMYKTDSADHSIIITSPVSKYITYSLQDANTIIVFHERRHFNQAKRVMEKEGFPDNK
ncbi:MAG: DinB family protein [Ignavibacteriae bacterium]|nr:MAG: DinB family protein [Ignavibacteriota bacterium]